MPPKAETPTATKPASEAKAKAAPEKPAPTGIDLYRARIKRVRSLAAAAGFDHFLVTNPKDVGYLTGFLGGDSYLLIGPRAVTLISDFRYREELEPVAPLARVHMRTGPIGDAVAELLLAAEPDRCGFQGGSMTVAERDALVKRLGKGWGTKFMPDAGVLTSMRIVKDAEEMKLIRRAIQIQEEALTAVLPTLTPGQTELEVAARLEAEMKTRGSSAPGFQTIVAVGANAALPHYRPGKTKLAAGKVLLIDWGAIYKGYHGDMTRAFTFGPWPDKIEEIYRIVLDAQLAAAEALAPGRSTREIDSIAREYIAQRGYGEFFGHGLGHGLGLDGHEDPRLSHMAAATELKPGHVVTIEPGVYLPGVGGVRIEDDYLITERGAVNLCTLPKDPAWATLA